MSKQLPTGKPILSIIIVNYNTKKLTQQCLKSLIRNDRRLDFGNRETGPNQEEIIPAQIIIIDNASTDGSKKMLTKFKKQMEINRNMQSSTAKYIETGRNMPVAGNNFKVIFNKKNLGFAKANNQGAKIAEGEYILLLNSDTIVKEGAISQSLLWLSSHPERDLLGIKLLNLDGTIQASVGKFPSLKAVFFMLFLDRISGGRSMSSPAKTTSVDWVMGAFMLMRREVFTKSKGFDENFFMYMEEAEWCYRLKKMNFKIGFYPYAKIIHLGRGSAKTGRVKPIINIYRGLIIFYKKHKPAQLPILKAILAIKAAISWSIGLIIKNEYLKKTYHQALAQVY